MNTSQAALHYYAAGWHPLELPKGAKYPPPEGRTGYRGADMTAAEVAAAPWAGNLGVRMPRDVLGLDVDVYKGGDKTLDELLARCGPLPKTWISHNGRNDGSGIRFYRVPVGMTWITGLPGLEIIQWGHRYAAVYPSMHPDGRAYGVWDQAEDEPAPDGLPLVEDLPELPWPWIAELARASHDGVNAPSDAVSADEVRDFLGACTQADEPNYVSTIGAHFLERVGEGYSRHDSMQAALIWAMECARAGIARADATLEDLGRAWRSVFTKPEEARRAELVKDHRVTEFDAMVRYAVGKAVAKTPEQMLRLHDEIAGVPINSSPAPSPSPEPEAFWLDWVAFSNREPTERRWLVARLWPWGRSMAMWAPAKEGKSELALWCAVHLALGRDPWTLEPTEPVEVAYFDYEMTEDDLGDRLDGFGIDPLELGRLHYALLPRLHALDTERGGLELEHYVREVGARAAVIDTYGRAVGGDENEADTVRAFYRFTGSRLKAMGVGYWRTDHAGKDPTKGQRGSSAKAEDVDIIWRMRRGKDGGADLDCSKSSRVGWVAPHLHLDRVTVGDALRYTTPLRFTWPEAVLAKAVELDTVGLPLTAGRRSAEAALRSAGIVPGRGVTIDEALEYRRERGASSP